VAIAPRIDDGAHMDGSILPIALAAFTVAYIAGWFWIGGWRLKR